MPSPWSRTHTWPAEESTQRRAGAVVLAAAHIHTGSQRVVTTGVSCKWTCPTSTLSTHVAELHYCLPKGTSISPAGTGPWNQREGSSGKHSSSLGKLSQDKATRICNLHNFCHIFVFCRLFFKLTFSLNLCKI